jgi:hypothetical protein
MSNTLTNLIPDLFEAMDVVSREQVGFIPAVTLAASAERAGVGETIRSHIAPAATAEDITPGTTPPDTGDQTIGNGTMTISKSRCVPFRWTGEEQKGVNNGPGYKNIRIDQIAQAIRTLCNEMETDLGALHTKASRAYGTAGTTPFASDLSDPAQLLKILKDNGCPASDLQLIIDTAAGAKLRTLGVLTKANEAGTTLLREQGVLLDIHGFKIRESSGIARFTKGTGASATTNTAGYAVGATVITLASAGTGTILAGDFVTFAGDTEKYAVVSGDSDVSNGGTFTLAAPGLRTAIGTSATAITVVGSSVRNMAFRRSAMVLACRAPALPEEGDAAEDRQLITDPISGMTFELAMYKQYKRVRYELGLSWGVQNFKTEHTAVLLG